MAIMNAMKYGALDPGATKRVKTTEFDEKMSNFPLDILNSNLDQSQNLNYSKANGTSEEHYDAEDVSSEVLSFSEEEEGVIKTESWLKQNDVMAQISSKNQKQSTLQSHDFDPFNKSELNLDDENEKFVLHREQESPLLNSLFGDTIGDALSHGSMLMLNIVMCLV
jgi:hypothetical protein